MTTKNYVIDTSAILDDPNVVNKCDVNSKITIPFCVLKELDQKKRKEDDLGRNAREFTRMLDDLTEDISVGCSIEQGNTIRVFDIDKNKSLPADEQIILIMKELTKQNPETYLISQDINMRVRAKSVGLKTKNIESNGDNKLSNLYTGIGKIYLIDEDLSLFYNAKSSQNLYLNYYENEFGPFYPNQFLVINNDAGGHTIGIVKTDEQGKYLKNIKNYNKSKSLECKPKNIEQNLAINLMLDDDITMVSLCGNAGTGKTLLALSCAIYLYREKQTKIVITKPNVPVGKDYGHLPGDIMDKMNPWLGSIYDNLNLLLPDKDYVDAMIENGIITIQPIYLSRGRSIPNSIIVVDEMQNCSKLETKTILTRCGENTRVFFTADLNQIDNSYVDKTTNGAAYCIEKLKYFDLTGHITLSRGERSAFSTLASKEL